MTTTSNLTDDWCMASVYLVTNTVTGKRYVGFTSGPVARRWRGHKDVASGGRGHALHAAMRKYGRTAFSFRVLATDMEPTRALWLEAEMIRELGTLSPAGYNLTTGGEQTLLSAETKARIGASNSGLVRTDEHRAKLRAAWLTRPRAEPKKRADPLETRAKISASLKGRRFTSEHCAKLAAVNLARVPVSETTRARMSASQRGKVLSAETRARMSEAFKGRTVSAETREKISATQRGRTKTAEQRARISEGAKKRPPISEATREKMSASHKARWARTGDV